MKSVEDLFRAGMTEAEIAEAFAEMKRRGLKYDKEPGEIRKLEYLGADISRHDLKTFSGIISLESHVKANWNSI